MVFMRHLSSSLFYFSFHKKKKKCVGENEERVGELSNEGKTFMHANFQHRPNGARRGKWVQVTLFYMRA